MSEPTSGQDTNFQQPGASKPTETKEEGSGALAIIGGLSWLVVPAFILVVANEDLQRYLAQNLWAAAAIAVALVLFIAALIFVPIFRKWLQQATASRQMGLFIFLGVPVLLGILIWINFLPYQWQVFAVRSGFIFVACLLPAALYYLFVVTRRGSLLNEFIANLARLGLLDFRDPEQAGLNRRRVEAYLQKFEATYGLVADNNRRDLGLEARGIPSAQTGMAQVFVSEAAVPVLIATFLVAIFWFIVLQPLVLGLASSGAAAQATISRPTLLQAPLAPNLTPVGAAFLGAYFFSLQMLFRRYVRRDLHPSAYVGTTQRILLAVISVWVIEKLSPLVLGSPRRDVRKGSQTGRQVAVRRDSFRRWEKSYPVPGRCG